MYYIWTSMLVTIEMSDENLKMLQSVHQSTLTN